MLRSYRRDDISLKDALSAAAPWLGEGGGALLYAVAWCRVALPDVGGVLRDERGQPVELASVYEARAFGANAELRWLNAANGSGRAVLLTEREPLLDGWERRDNEFLGTIRQRYLLWGKVEEAYVPGWSSLVSNRVGKLLVPVSGAGGQRVALESMEYLGEFDHGNVAVFEERLLGLTPGGSSHG